MQQQNENDVQLGDFVVPAPQLVEDARYALQQIVDSVIRDDRDYNLVMEAVQHYQAMVNRLHTALTGERDAAIEELATLEQAIEDEDRDNPLVDSLYTSAFEEGFEAGVEDTQEAFWEDGLQGDYDEGYDAGRDALLSEIKETIALLMDCDPSAVGSLAIALTDYYSMVKSQANLERLKELALKASGEWVDEEGE